MTPSWWCPFPMFFSLLFLTALWMDAFLEFFLSSLFSSERCVRIPPLPSYIVCLTLNPLPLPLMPVYSLCWDDMLFLSDSFRVSKYSS